MPVESDRNLNFNSRRNVVKGLLIFLGLVGGCGAAGGLAARIVAWIRYDEKTGSRFNPFFLPMTDELYAQVKEKEQTDAQPSASMREALSKIQEIWSDADARLVYLRYGPYDRDNERRMLEGFCIRLGKDSNVAVGESVFKKLKEIQQIQSQQGSGDVGILTLSAIENVVEKFGSPTNISPSTSQLAGDRLMIIVYGKFGYSDDPGLSFVDTPSGPHLVTLRQNGEVGLLRIDGNKNSTIFQKAVFDPRSPHPSIKPLLINTTK